MFGLHAFGDAAFSELGDQWPVIANILQSPDTIYLAEIAVQSGAGDADTPGGISVFAFGEAPFSGDEGDPNTSGQSMLYLSDAKYISLPTDTIPNQYYSPRLSLPLSASRRVMLTPLSAIDGAQSAHIEIHDNDGTLSTTIASLSVDSQPIRVLAGPEGGSYAEFVTIFQGSGVQFESDEKTVRVILRDNSYLLDRPVQPIRYAGTGTYEGTTDMEGALKPLALGLTRSISPILIDPVYLIYQLNDGPVQAISVAYDKGLALTAQGDTADLYAGSTTAGSYRTDLSRGLIQLGSIPAGTVTADVQGDNTGGYVSTIAEIALRLIRDKVGMSATYIDTSSFASLAVDVASVGGIYITEDMTGREVLTRLMRGIGAFWYCSRIGRISAKRLTEPDATEAVIELDTVNVMRLRKLPVPETVYPPTFRWTVNFQRCWTVQASDIAASVTAAVRKFLAKEWRSANDTDSSVTLKYPSATDAGPIDTYLDVEADAKVIAEDLLALHSVDRAMYEVTISMAGLEVEMGATARLTWPSFGLDSGKYFRVFPLQDNLRERLVTLLLWG